MLICPTGWPDVREYGGPTRFVLETPWLPRLVRVKESRAVLSNAVEKTCPSDRVPEWFRLAPNVRIPGNAAPEASARMLLVALFNSPSSTGGGIRQRRVVGPPVHQLMTGCRQHTIQDRYA